MPATQRLPYLALLCIAPLLLTPGSASANCTADSGSVEDIRDPDVTVTCDTSEPNPFPGGIGSISTDTGLTATVETDAIVISSGVGVTLDDDGTLTNDGRITATDEAVLSVTTASTQRSTITNSGTLESTGGIAVNTGAGTADITNTGSVFGKNGGIWMTSGQLDNTGSIEITDAAGLAVSAGSATSIDNSGSIVSSGRGIDLGDNATFDNSGEVVSEQGSAATTGAGAEITNSGRIEASGADAIVLAAGATLDNSGTVDASGGAAVNLASGASVTNTGTLTSSSGAAVIASGGASIDNGGQLEGNAGEAVQLTGGGNTLTLRSGSSLSGDAVATSGATGTDALVLEESGSEDDDFVNFDSLTLRSGAWSLAGTVQAREVFIESGTLTINGHLDTRDAAGTASTITLTTGTLAGAGSIRADVNNVSGTVSAGNPGGTLTVDGDYRQASGATMRIAGSSSDVGQLHVTGTADLAGSLVVSAGSDVVADIVTADGGISGFFDDVQVSGRALVAVVPTADSIRLVRTSTTLEDNMVEANLDNTYLLLDSLAPPVPGSGSGAWARGVGYYGSRSESGGLPGGDYWIGGFLIGGDWLAAERWRVGGAVGYTSTDLDADDDSSGDADSWNYGAYVLYDAGGFWGSLTLAGSSGSYDQHRNIVVNDQREKVPASYDSTAYAARGSIGLRTRFLDELAGRWVFEPLLSVDYVVTDLDDYADEGGSGLEYQIGDIESLQLSGLLRARALPTADSGFAPRMHAGIVYREALDDRNWQARSPDGGISVVLPGNDDDQTFGVAAAGFEARVGGRGLLHADLVGQFSDDKNTYGLIAGLRLTL